LNLTLVSRALAEQRPRPAAELERRERMLNTFGTVTFTGFGLVILAAVGGIIYTIVTKMILDGRQPVAGVLLALFVLFAGLALTYVILNETLKDKRAERDRLPAPGAKAADTADLLSDRPVAALPSVTEGPTEILGSRLDTAKFTPSRLPKKET
jgi:hypothetical protein